jgi:hypothetical protein
MFAALRSAVLTIGFCMVAAVAAIWLGDLNEPAPASPVRGVHLPQPCLDCRGGSMTAVTPR